MRDDVLFGSFEHVGDDYLADQTKMAADLEMQLWWALTDACQIGFDDDSRWRNMAHLDEVWHHD